MRLTLTTLCLLLAGCHPQPRPPMQPEAMAIAIAHCHSLGLRASELTAYSGVAGGNIIVTGIQCRTPLGG